MISSSVSRSFAKSLILITRRSDIIGICSAAAIAAMAESVSRLKVDSLNSRSSVPVKAASAILRAAMITQIAFAANQQIERIDPARRQRAIEIRARECGHLES